MRVQEAPSSDLDERWLRAAQRYAVALAIMERDRQLLLWSRAATRSRGRRIRGSSDDRTVIFERLRALIADGVLPRKPPTKVYAGHAPVAHECVACGQKIVEGHIEFETTCRTAEPAYVHPACFELWRQGVDRQSA